MKFPSHSGTHIDFPKHFSDEGKTSNDYSADFWIFNNPFLLYYKANKNEIIDLNNLLHLIPSSTDFLIIKTGFHKCRNSVDYWKNNPGLDPELAPRLKSTCPNLKVIGFDFISISSFSNREMGRIAHRKFLVENEILVIEDMSLIEASNKIEKVYCFPLLINGIDGCPVTVIGEIIE